MHTFPLSTGTGLSLACAGPVHAACVPVSSYCISTAALRGPCFLGVSSVLSGSYNFSASSSAGFLNPKGRYLMQTSCSGVSVARSFILCILSGCGFLYLFPSTVAGNFSVDCWARNSSIYEYRRMSLGTILLLHSFNRTVVFHFLLGSGLI